MKISGGAYKNRKLVVPDGFDVRPTSDRMRQSLFNMLMHAKWASDFDFTSAKVLDLFCGSGALGLEALSHGAPYCTFVDMDISSVKTNAYFLDKNDYDLKKSDACNVGLVERYNLVFMDPPYRQNLIEPALRNLADKDVLAADALVVIESEKNSTFVTPDDFIQCDFRVQGQSALYILRYNPAID
jgi:16S rRNA (guanine966-N2)-methyltransferase